MYTLRWRVIGNFVGKTVVHFPTDIQVPHTKESGPTCLLGRGRWSWRRSQTSRALSARHSNQIPHPGQPGKRVSRPIRRKDIVFLERLHTLDKRRRLESSENAYILSVLSYVRSRVPAISTWSARDG